MPEFPPSSELPRDVAGEEDHKRHAGAGNREHRRQRKYVEYDREYTRRTKHSHFPERHEDRGHLGPLTAPCGAQEQGVAHCFNDSNASRCREQETDSGPGCIGEDGDQ